jgi:TniB protein
MSEYLDMRQPLTTKEGWAAFVSRSQPDPPRLLTDGDLNRIDPLERKIYDEARMDYHSELLLVATPDIRQITTTGSKLIVNNRGKQLGRRGLIVSGPSGTGKSTSITQLGKKHQIDLERRASSSSLVGRIPVVYIIVPPAATPKMLAIQLAHFLGLPVGTRDSQNTITQTVTSVLRRVGCSLILVDEVHRLDLRTRSGADASDQLKYFFDSISATFVYAGLDLAENGMFSGTRGRQIAGRFLSLSTRAFAHATAEQRSDWSMLVTTMEHTLRLHHHRAGTLLELAPYLHQRTGGMIGSLDQLVYEAANDAISDGSEKITKKHLEAVVLDTAAEEQRDLELPRPTARAGRRATP